MTETSIAAPEWIALTVVAWLATYIVHSTLLIGTVWGFTRCCALDSLTRSLLWKLALVGGLFTATLQTGLGVRPWLGQVAVAGEEEEAESEARWEARSPRVLLPRMLALHVDGAAHSDELEALIEARAEAIEAEAEAIEAQAEAIEAVAEAIEAQAEAIEVAAEQVEVQAEQVEARAEALAEAHESEAAQVAVQAERDGAQAQRDAAQAQRDGVQTERDAIQSERDARQAERDAVQAARDELSLALASLHDGDPRSAGFMVFTGPSSDCRGPACPWVHVSGDSQALAPVGSPGSPAEGPTRGPWGLLAGLFLLGMVLSVGRLVWLASRLRAVLRGREALTHGGLRERLHRLMTRARLRSTQVRLTLSPVLRSPIALASREIVVPTRALDLDAHQQEAMLAHELAHVVRRDPAWLVLAAVIEAALFIQPLNRVARRGMQEAAEELSDDWAVRHIGDGLHLARCLAEVAGWLERGRSDAMFVSPMASESGSILVRRVRRLLEAGPRRGLAVQWRMLLAACLLFAAGFGAPGFAPALAHAGEAVAPSAPRRLAALTPVPPPPPAMLAPGAPPAMLAPMAPPAPLAMLAPMAPLAPPAMLAPPAPRAVIVPVAPRAALAPVAPRAVLAPAAPSKPTLRQRRLERRADRLTKKAIKQAEKAVVLRERSGLQNTCPDESQAQRRRSQSETERAVAVALAGAHAATRPRIAVMRLPDHAELERQIAEGLRELPDADELRREIEEGLRELPDADELRREIEAGLRELPDADALRREIEAGLRELPSQADIERQVEAGLRELPSQADLERQLQAALRELPKDLPNRAEVERSLRDAIKNLPNKAAIQVQVKDALKNLPSKAQIDRQVNDALKHVPNKAQIERQVRDAMRNVPNKADIDRQVRDALKNLPNQLPNKAEIERQVREGLRNLPDAATLERQVKQAERAREQAERARRRGR